MYSTFIKNGLIAVLLFFLVQSVFASDVVLVDISNDEDANITKMGLLIDDTTGEAKEIYKKELDPANRIVSLEKYPLVKVESGVTFLKRKDREIVKLKATNCHPADGADLVLDYLYNGVSGERKKQDLKVERIGQKWVLRLNERAVRKLHFASNKHWMLGTIGIKGIKLVK